MGSIKQIGLYWTHKALLDTRGSIGHIELFVTYWAALDTVLLYGTERTI